MGNNIYRAYYDATGLEMLLRGSIIDSQRNS